MGHPIYHLDLRTELCHVQVRLNGVPVAELTATGEQPEWFAPPLNPYLVGAGNALEVVITPLKDGQPSDDFSALKVEGVVRRYEKGAPVGPGSGPLVYELTVMAALAERIKQAKDQDQKLAVPQSFVERFDNEATSFAAELTQGSPLGDEQALRDYAMRLRDLMRARDVPGLARECAGKVQAYAAAYQDDPARIAQSLEQVLRDEYLPRGMKTDFERDEVELMPVAEGRLWELRRPGGLPFIQTEPDGNGSKMQMPVVVGLHQGALGVVR